MACDRICAGALPCWFSYTYVSYYAGLASPMIALVFLYFTASIFIYGGEVNSALRAAACNADDAAPVGR